MDYQKLSKEISYALRHAPHEYELELDEAGWVDISQLLTALNGDARWATITEDDLQQMLAHSDKKRHELADGRIRALYGHSVSKKLIKQAEQPPDQLFHGTARRFLPSILKEGLKPRGRQYVHLSSDTDTASVVGKRRDDQPVILSINAQRAWKDGVQFYHGNEMIWLADYIEPKYIETDSAETD